MGFLWVLFLLSKTYICRQIDNVKLFIHVYVCAWMNSPILRLSVPRIRSRSLVTCFCYCGLMIGLKFDNVWICNNGHLCHTVCWCWTVSQIETERDRQEVFIRDKVRGCQLAVLQFGDRPASTPTLHMLCTCSVQQSLFLCPSRSNHRTY